MVVTKQFSLSVIKSNELSWTTRLPARSASCALTKTALPKAVQLLRMHKILYCLMWLQWSEMDVHTHVTTSVIHDHELHAQAEIFIYRLVRIFWSSGRYFNP